MATGSYFLGGKSPVNIHPVSTQTVILPPLLFPALVHSLRNRLQRFNKGVGNDLVGVHETVTLVYLEFGVEMRRVVS